MKTATTDEAFEQMIHTRGIYKQLNLAQYTVMRIRLDLKKGALSMSLDRKIELLKLAGWHIAQEMKWAKKVKQS